MRTPKLNVSNVGSFVRYASNTRFKSSPSKTCDSDLAAAFTLDSLKLVQASDSGNSPAQVYQHIHSILRGDVSFKRPEPQESDEAKDSEGIPDIPWLSNISHSNTFLQRKEVSRERKQKCKFKWSQVNRFDKLLKLCANKLGTEATIEMLNKLGQEIGVKDYIALIEICVDKARATNDEDVAIQQMASAFHLLKLMKEQGFQIEEQTYHPLLMYIIDMGMVEEFKFFCEAIKGANPNLASRLGYYEMMLWVKVNNEEKVQELCNYITANDDEETSDLRENYLLGLCESDKKKELLQVLEIIDIKRLSSAESVAKIFQSLGRLLLGSVAEHFLLDFVTCDHEADNITNFIASYVISMPNLAVEDAISKFKDLHGVLGVSPSSSSYEKLILHICGLLKVPVVLDIVDEMCKGGITLSTGVLNSILRICDETNEHNLVHRIYSVICCYKLEANDETFRCMIDLCTKMKDFDSAYKMLNGSKEMNLKPTVGMYNAIMAGYLRENKISDAVRVLGDMQCADVQPDLQTFIYLISSSESEGDIDKSYEELKLSGIRPTKQILMALTNAYAACGQLEKAKQVVLDPTIPAWWLNEIKYVLVSALASCGQLSEALLVYEEIKNDGHSLEPKDVLSIIEKIHSPGELDKLLLLLKELGDQDYWTDGCCKIILYCVRNKHLSSAVDLVKQLKEKFHSDERVMEVLFDKVFSLSEESDSAQLQAGLDLLWLIRDELGILPSQKCLDCLLGASFDSID